MSAVDVIAVRQNDGSIKATPFCVRFAKKQKITRIVNVVVNGKEVVNESKWGLVVENGELFAKFVRMDSIVETSCEKSDTLERKR